MPENAQFFGLKDQFLSGTAVLRALSERSLSVLFTKTSCVCSFVGRLDYGYFMFFYVS